MQERNHVDWRIVEPEFHREWSARYAPLGLSWEEVKPAFRFGWQHAQLPGYAQYDWREVADDLAQHWYMPLETAEEMAWDNLQDAIRYGWERARQVGHRKRALVAPGEQPGGGPVSRPGPGAARPG